VDALLAAGVKPSVWEARKKQTPLHLAALKGHASCVTSLLRGGADPVATTKKGETPFDLGSHHPEVGRALRDHLDQQQQAATAAAATKEAAASAVVAPENAAVTAETAPAPAPVAAAAATAEAKSEAAASSNQEATAAVATARDAPRDDESEPAKKKAKKEKKKAKGFLSLSHLEDGDVAF